MYRLNRIISQRKNNCFSRKNHMRKDFSQTGFSVNFAGNKNKARNKSAI
jgi:hypothetical protein